jgi:hypothetical protein
MCCRYTLHYYRVYFLYSYLTNTKKSICTNNFSCYCISVSSQGNVASVVASTVMSINMYTFTNVCYRWNRVEKCIHTFRADRPSRYHVASKQRKCPQITPAKLLKRITCLIDASFLPHRGLIADKELTRISRTSTVVGTN